MIKLRINEEFDTDAEIIDFLKSHNFESEDGNHWDNPHLNIHMASWDIDKHEGFIYNDNRDESFRPTDFNEFKRLYYRL